MLITLQAWLSNPLIHPDSLLYDQLKYKDRIHLRSRVDSIELIDGDIQVTTKDHRSYRGDILIGADGIHSSVRLGSSSWASVLQIGCDVGRSDIGIARREEFQLSMHWVHQLRDILSS